jgi:hypothetical protein
MTASNVHDLVETWRCAIRLLPSDPRALAALLKSDTPMPHGVRYLIGEIFHHGNRPLIDITVKPKRTKAVSKAVDKLNVSREYERRRYAISALGRTCFARAHKPSYSRVLTYV